MTSTVQCMHEEIHGTFEDNETYTRICKSDVTKWRDCGAGCKQRYAFCDAHGGDKLASQMMRGHVTCEHKKKPADPFCPEHGRCSRPSHTPGLRCDCEAVGWKQARKVFEV